MRTAVGMCQEQLLLRHLERRGSSQKSLRGVPSTRFDIDILKVPQSEAVIEHKHFNIYIVLSFLKTLVLATLNHITSDLYQKTKTKMQQTKLYREVGIKN